MNITAIHLTFSYIDSVRKISFFKKNNKQTTKMLEMHASSKGLVEHALTCNLRVIAACKHKEGTWNKIWAKT